MSSYIPDNNIYPTEFENCPDFLKNYLAYLMNNQGKRPLTLSQAALTLREFCQYVHFKGRFGHLPPTFDAHKDMGLSAMQLDELAQLNQSDIEEYISFLELSAHNSASTLRKKLSTIRPFFSYLVRMQGEMGVPFIHGNPAQNIVSPAAHEPPQIILSAKQLNLMIGAVPEETSLRDRAIMLLLSTTGISVSELAFIQVTDVQTTGWLSITGSNGTRGVWLTGPCQEAITDYLRYSGVSVYAEKSDFLFPSARQPNKPITQRTIRNIVTKAAENARILMDGEVTPKVIRDSVAKILYQTAAAYEQVSVSQYLGYRISSSRYVEDSHSTRYTEDITVQNIIRRSPLNSLGAHVVEVIQ